MYRYDSRVKAMEVDERPTEQYSDIGGLDQQIQEVYICVYWCWLYIPIDQMQKMNSYMQSIQ
jgi:ATP-dependent 26S proteasome regulatory subunit